jgi:hypothetical protein
MRFQAKTTRMKKNISSMEVPAMGGLKVMNDLGMLKRAHIYETMLVNSK